MELIRKQILLLRFSAMGDVALLAPVVQAFTQRYPDVSITLVTRPAFAVFFSGFPNVLIVKADFNGRHKGFGGLVRLFGELRQLAPVGMVVDVHQNLRSGVLKGLFRLIGVPAVTIDKGRREKGALTRKENKIRRPLPHSIDRYAQTFDRAGFALQPDRPFRFSPFPSSERELATFFDRHALRAKPHPWLGMAPFAQHEQKMWPFDRFAPLLTTLFAGPPLTVFLFGGGSAEVAQLESLQLQFPKVILVAGQLSMAAELALICQLDGMLCMDSGNMHLAALSGVPVLSIWGSTHPDAGFGPWGQGDEAIVQIPTDALPCRPCSVFGNKPCWRGDLACLNDISVNAVASRVRELISLA